MTNILDVLKGLSLDELEKQRTELIESVIQTEAEIATLAHVIVAVKALTPRKPMPSVTTAFKEAIERVIPAAEAYTFLAQNQPETLPAVAEWPAELTPKEPPVSASELQAAIAELPDMSNPSVQAFNATVNDFVPAEITDGSKSQKRAKRYGMDPAFEVLPVDTFDMENVSMERKVRTYLEAAGSATSMAMARAFDLPNAKTLIRLLESDPAYERDSRGFWSIKK